MFRLKSFSHIILLSCLTATLATGRDDALLADFSDDPIEMDELEVNADKASNFTLPLDSKPASGSRLGLDKS